MFCARDAIASRPHDPEDAEPTAIAEPQSCNEVGRGYPDELVLLTEIRCDTIGD